MPADRTLDFTYVLVKIFLICIKLDYFYFSTFDLESKATEISKNTQFFVGEKHSYGQGMNNQVLAKYKF